MNMGILAMLFIVAVGAVMGIFVIAGAASTTPYVDSVGTTTDARTNASQSVVGNYTAPVSGAIGGGLIIIFAIIILVVVIGGIWLAAKNSGYGNLQSRYR
jgi:hypothetical protein